VSTYHQARHLPREGCATYQSTLTKSTRETTMKRKTPAGNIPTQKKSVSKASADKGREDSRAVQINREKNERRIEAKGNPRKLADAYAERATDVDRQRKVTRGKHKQSDN
jgi:hypothetical protein